MAGMGPPPKPAEQRARRNATIAMTRLPAEGRPGEAPEWPFEDERRDELVLWAELWRTPQAVEWERLRWHREVAMYARMMSMAQTGDINAAKEARQLSDRLGLSPLALLRLRWEIAPAEAAAAKPTRGKSAAARYSKLRVVQTGA
jgi:hypothetical protein